MKKITFCKERMREIIAKELKIKPQNIEEIFVSREGYFEITLNEDKKR